jgi:acyl transferase domain-containing protein
VSSFGAGGANAHLIVAEFPAGATEVSVTRPAVEHVVLLSARTREQLRTLAATLAKDISSHGAEAGYPERLAWSTQIGRREMRDRLAVPFTDLTELRAALEDFATGRETTAVLAGSVLPNDRRNHPDDEDEDDRAYLDVLIEKRRVRKLARLWVDGAAVEWSRLWAGSSPRRVDLPPYPFTMKRYWSPSGPASVPRADEVPAAPVNSDGDLRAAVEGDLRMAACGFLLVDPDEVDIDGDLMELGFDSVSLVELMIQMDETFGIELDVSVVLDHPTLRAIAGYLVREHPDEVAKRHNDGPAR